MVAEPAPVETFLKAQGSAVSRSLRLAVGSGLAIGLLVILQAWLVARIVSAALFDKAGLGDVAHELLALPPLFLARAALAWTGERAAFEAAATVKHDLRLKLLDHLLALGPMRLPAMQTGTLAAALTDSIEAIHPYYARYLPAASLSAMLPLAVLVAVLPNDWISALVFVVTAPLIPLFMVLIGRGAEELNQRQWGGLMRMSGHLLDTIQGLTTLKLFNASRREAGVVSAMAESYRRDTMAVLRIAFLSSLALEFFATVSIAIVAVLIGFRLLWGDMTFFSGFFVLLLAPEFYAPLRSLGAHYHARMEAIGAAEKLVELLAAPAPPAMPGRSRLASPKPPAITFEDVHVIFDDGRKGLDGLSFHVASGENVAIVGSTGAGKSTIFNLLLGFLAPSGGRILVDGIPLSEIDAADWRRSIGWVPQRPHLFLASVAENVAMAGMDGGARDDARIAEALRQASAFEFVSRLPDRLDTVVAEGGVGISGGEAQRIALARALYRRPRLVLLDEPTGHLDRSTQQAILDATARLVTGCTALTIAHRLDTIRRADRILVIDNGRLAEAGTHDALVEAGGYYARLLAAGSGGKEWHGT